MFCLYRLQEVHALQLYVFLSTDFVTDKSLDV